MYHELGTIVDTPACMRVMQLLRLHSPDGNDVMAAIVKE